jgi:hypothetical protein
LKKVALLFFDHFFQLAIAGLKKMINEYSHVGTTSVTEMFDRVSRGRATRVTRH